MIDSPYVEPLDGTGCDAGRVGGKAAGIDRLVAHGFPVPPAVAITVAAYRRFVECAGIAPALIRIATTPAPSPNRLAEDRSAVDRLFMAGPMPADLGAAITDTAGGLLAAGPVAVRSSATAEDLGSASFAGQYLTVTDVAGTEELLPAVRRCWASLWYPGVRAYRERHQIEEADLSMAVVVQSMVRPDWSGVAFTRNPDGDPGTLRIEAVAGLGEALVSGRVTPTDYTVGRATLRVAGADRSPGLVFLEDLARLALRVESELDAPQDIEWAYDGDGLWLLQSRPITSAGPASPLDDGFDRPATTVDTYTPRGVVEMLPGVLDPLVWTINAPMLEEAFRRIVADLGGDPGDVRRRFIGRFRGRAALNLSALRDVASALPGGSRAEVERQFLGRELASSGDETGPAGGLRSLFRTRRAFRRVREEVEVVTAAVEALGELDVDLVDLPAEVLLRYRSGLRALAWRAVAAEAGASSAAVASYRALVALLQRWYEAGDAATWAQRLTAGAMLDHAVGSVRLQAVRAFCADTASEFGAGLAAVAAVPVSNAPDRLADLGRPGRDVLASFRRLARCIGSIAVYAGPTYEDRPDLLWDQVALVASNLADRTERRRDDSALADLETELTGRRWWTLARIATGQIVDLRLALIRRQSQEASRFLADRERAKAALLRLGGEERRIIVEVGRRIVASGHLQRIDQVTLLGDVELEAALLGRSGVPPPELTRREAIGRRSSAAGPLPEVFQGTPGDLAPVTVAGGGSLDGWAASPGRMEGPVRLVHTLQDGAKLETGDVLVAHTTDPSWTPLFLVAGAIVLEEGGPLSHGAIVAREFGIPAVVNVRGVLQALSDGEQIEVDGTSGRIRRRSAEGTR